MIYETYVFPNEHYRLLGRTLTEKFNLKKGDLAVLAPINNAYHHPANCYVYSIETGRCLGRYAIRDFEVLKEFESIEELQQYTQTQIVFTANESKQEEESPETEEVVFEQLELF